MIKAAATGLGSGYVPRAPGTAGTVVGIPLYLVFSRFPWPLYLLSIVAFSFFAVYVAQEAEKIFQKEDAPQIVIDEIAGLQFTLFLVTPTVWHLFWGFVLFRLFDIIKPFPARHCHQRLSGGYGVVGDDVVAGVHGNISLLLLIGLFGI